MKRIIISILAIMFIIGSSVITYAGEINFKDLSKAHWAFWDIEKMVNDHIVSGYPDGTFRPDIEISYGEFIKLAVVAVSGDDPGPSDTGHWAADYYNKGIAIGLFTSEDITLNMLETTISRADMALIASNSVDKKVSQNDQDIISTYITDIEQSKNRKNEIIKAFRFGIISGYPDKSFRPKDRLTRAEAISVVIRMVDPTARISINMNSLISQSPYEEEVYKLINKVRATMGLPQFIYNNRLAEVAETKAADMGDKDYFAHESPTYGSPFKMIDSFGIEYLAAGENIAMGYSTPDEVMDGWMNSPQHKENILYTGYTDVGIGHIIDEDGVAYWVQLFIFPR